ncbi:tRNA pseudouridine synthase B [Photobacterium damselae subsp. piscicida]|uniref:tRNA pseudouridine synthase B n=1 Tax=Photobacterium damsela subsp. piscicida TaxID=38294 RepID=A0A1V1V9A9_PHODP|nr:tRNA pseudouridine(55) synthase TruB [Photobacterium damselae]MBE8130026.1 tRNA pseudouridine(55) synthase TruB [Photobacterium damselae subsp. piscicida]PSV81272.1 tRNA pseudouridine(55) synthase TruB [Photobacterium damselae]PSW85613.1 tRNA pseudouridine(55) synthase TruB [Photobacterium damselae]QOD52212.1 tRNA pseudouridine(55) synthase TruB [Photobacterium damselae subsp. piscicida]QOD56065.1 tRNA pseudouridine(55) synthase TruB [Photobacterium damselae subsp. piscicida]
MARRRKGRPIDGVILVDKPTGISSNDTLQKVKRIFFAQKAGHTGALDPLATGMLPICFGEATKFSQFLLDSDKRYRVIAKLGERTDTSDFDGQVVETRDVKVDRGQLERCIAKFRGTTDQIPSMYSALKYKGRKLYEYAREGVEVPRESRKITVYSVDLLRFDSNEVEMELHVSKGTYIRTIVDDLGEMLGCGAHVIMLRRIGVSHYPVDRMVTIEQLALLADQAKEKGIDPHTVLDTLLLPTDTAVQDLPEVNILPAQAVYALHGNPVRAARIPEEGTLVRITVGEKRDFIGVGTIEKGMLAPKRVIAEQQAEA